MNYRKGNELISIDGTILEILNILLILVAGTCHLPPHNIAEVVNTSALTMLYCLVNVLCVLSCQLSHLILIQKLPFLLHIIHLLQPWHKIGEYISIYDVTYHLFHVQCVFNIPSLNLSDLTLIRTGIFLYNRYMYNPNHIIYITLVFKWVVVQPGNHQVTCFTTIYGLSGNNSW